MAPSIALRSAVRLHQEARFEEAERQYRGLLSGNNDDARVPHLLGMLCHQTRRSDEAGEIIPRPRSPPPLEGGFHNKLGPVLGLLRQHEEELWPLSTKHRL